MTSNESGSTTAQPKVVFRIPTTAILAIIFLVVCITPVALSGIPGLQALYLVPLVLLVFVFRVKTVADGAGLTVYAATKKRDIAWSNVQSLAISDRSRVSAVLSDDSHVTLPTVRTRHLPVLSMVSGGRFADPSGITTNQVTADESRGEKTNHTER